MWRVRRSVTNALVSDMICSPNARKPAALKYKGLPISSLNRMPRFRTRNLALRVSAIEWTDAHAIRPSLSDLKRFWNCKYRMLEGASQEEANDAPSAIRRADQSRPHLMTCDPEMQVSSQRL